jgi:hypothetical protein
MLASLASLGYAASCDSYRKVTDDECADACIGSTVGICPRSVVVKGGGLTAGKCADIGFTIEDGATDQAAGPCGTIHFTTYKHTATVANMQADFSLVTFDGTPSTTFKFAELNDPVMGGQSHGTWTQSSFGVIDGQVLDVPSLKAPGFIKAAADGNFADVSGALGGALLLNVRTSTPEYKGFRVSFASGTVSAAYACAGGGSIPLSRGCFKAKFSVPAGSDWSTVRIPFTSFSDKWSPATGEQTTTCADDADVCPSAKTLAAISRIELWGEGADGQVHPRTRIRHPQIPHSAGSSPSKRIQHPLQILPSARSCRSANLLPARPDPTLCQIPHSAGLVRSPPSQSRAPGASRGEVDPSGKRRRSRRDRRIPAPSQV